MDDRATNPLLASLASALSGRYDIDREIGRGGMATVYLARDVRHTRPVALKVLSPELGAVLGAERFLSEIRVTANLQHPNLLPLFDSGEADGLLFYVMPYVEGESLRHRLEREKQLPIDEAVAISVGIANALDYAHRHGVIHRDLKPENILLHDGQPLVADFGIALAVSNAGGQRVTQTGLSLGTPQYMSPEQATSDRSIDGRTDIYSLGALTYEMLSGEPPHIGHTAQAVIARLMTEEPRPLVSVRRSVPPHVDAAVRRALEKLPADRFATAKEFADAMQGRGAATSAVHSGYTSSHKLHPRRLAAFGTAAVALAVLAVAADRSTRSRSTPPVPARFTIEMPPDRDIVDRSGNSIAISPDGRTLAFLAESKYRLFVRRLDRLDAVPIPRSEGAVDPKFSPDGKAVVFTFSSTTRVVTAPVDVADAVGAVTTLADLPASTAGIAWGHSSDPLAISRGSLWRVARGGSAVEVARVDTTRLASWDSPWVFPDGRTIAVRTVPKGSRYGSAADRLGFISIDGRDRVVTDLESQNVLNYIDGVLVFGRVGGRIMATRFDLAHRKPIGDPVMMVQDAIYKGAGGVSAALSDNGTLAYLAGSAVSNAIITDEHGAVLVTLPDAREYGHPAWSPDGKRFAIEIIDAGRSDIWVYDRASRVLSRLTQTGDALTPIWTADGKRIAFVTNSGVPWWTSSDGSGAPELIPLHGLDKRRRVNEVAFTPDGRSAIARYQPSSQLGAGWQFVLLSLVDDKPPTTLVEAKPEISLGQPSVSPDGKWLSYYSSENGANEIYVRAMGGDGRVQVTSGGGTSARWASDSRRLFFRTSTAAYAATIDVSGSDARLVRTDSLFSAPFFGPGGYGSNFAPRADGKEFVHMRRAGGGPKIVVVTNFMEEVKAKLGGKQ
jgi:eukaryotic-like serine/threonine-protein kinase